MLDYRIHTFLALYEEMNYRKTAERLNMTQPGVTHHIQCLEKYYGIKLFEYDGRTLRRTRNAELLKKHIDSILTEENTVMRGFMPSDVTHLSIGATKTIGEFILVPMIRNFLLDDRHNVDLWVDNTENLLHMLEHGQIDFAMVEGVFNKSKYSYHLFKKEKFVGICGKNHPIAGKTVSVEEIFGEDIAVREKGSGTRRLLEQAIEDRGFSFYNFKRCVSVSNFSVICELVAKDGMITFAYEPIAQCRDDITTFAIEDFVIQGEFNFVYCNEKIARPKIDLFLGEVNE